jgi:ribonuclease-3
VAGRNNSGIESLVERLGYDFNHLELLQKALTHSSARVAHPEIEDNERLEFLGDRVLGLAIAELLAEQFPAADTGEMAKRFNRLVRKETCAEIARELELGEYVIMSDGEAESGGRYKTTILGDTCEAVLGAVCIDGGYQPARSMIRRLWEPHLEATESSLTDAKSALQEWAQGRGLPLPRYREVARKGPDHAPRFTSHVEIEGLEPEGGDGSSKRAAEQAAASAMLLREGVWERTSDG